MENWIRFTTETGLIGSYAFCQSENDYKLKLLSRVGKTHYYSCVNEIGAFFDENIKPTLNEIVIGNNYFTKNGVGEIILLTISGSNADKSIYYCGWNIARKKEDLASTYELAKNIKY
jgi:hypothetical protein